jgi:hypothetical protein
MDCMRPSRLVLAAALWVSAPAWADETTQLTQGDILLDSVPVEGSDIPKVILKGVVEAPPAQVWAFISHCDLYAGRMPRIVESKELSREDNVATCRTVLDAPWPVSKLTSTTKATMVEHDGTFTRTWKLESGDYALNEGSWTLSPFGGDAKRTLVLYQVRVQPKTSVPGFVQRWAQKSGLPDMLKAVRTWAADPANQVKAACPAKP